jgi:hypothetical protein
MFTYGPTAGARCHQDGTGCGVLSNFLALGQRTAARGADFHARLDEQGDLAGWALNVCKFDSSLVTHRREPLEKSYRAFG